MAESLTVVRRDVAQRDIAGATFIIAGNLQIDGPNNRIRVGEKITLDGANTRILVSDGSTNRILLDGSTGKFKVARVGFNVLTAANADLIMSSDFSFVKEVWLPMHPQWDNSWTQSDTYVDVTGALNTIDFADWPDHTWYFEMIGKTDDGTGSYQLYNNTTAAAVTGSEITTTSTSAVRIRSSACTKPTGANVIIIQHKQTGGGGTGYVNSIMSRSVFRID